MTSATRKANWRQLTSFGGESLPAAMLGDLLRFQSGGIGHWFRGSFQCNSLPARE